MIKLPEPVGYFSSDWSLTPYGMKLMQSSNPEIAQTFEPAYSKQAIRDALEEAAKVCEGFKQGNSATYIDDDWADMCAAAIRKLKEDTQ